MAARAEKLYYQGEMVPTAIDAEGNVLERGPSLSFPGVPARDLEASDIRKLSDATYESLTGGRKPVYTTTPSGRKSPEKPAANKAEPENSATRAGQNAPAATEAKPA